MKVKNFLKLCHCDSENVEVYDRGRFFVKSTICNLGMAYPKLMDRELESWEFGSFPSSGLKIYLGPVSHPVKEDPYVEDAVYVSEWDGGYKVSSKCKVNILTREVFDIEVSEDENTEMLDVLDREYISFGGQEYPVDDKDPNGISFWRE